MGFKSGRATFVRYWVSGESPLPFGEEHFEMARNQLAGRNKPSDAADGISVGWTAGEHVLDLEFDLAKNVFNDCLHLALRIDSDKIPGSLLRAYTKMETDARAKDNPSGFPTKAQRQEAKEAARHRAEMESADGRFRRMKQFELLWDGRNGILYAGTTSASALDRLHLLFQQTFDRNLSPITAGLLAVHQTENRGAQKSLENVAPASFHGGQNHYSAVAWSGNDPTNLDYFGNEFLIWLWHYLHNDGDTLTLADASEVTVMLNKTLVLDCPRGETGRDTLADEGPTRMPEAFRALQAGKLPRKAGMVLVRHGDQFQLTLQAESFSISGLNLPKREGLSGTEVYVARVESFRDATEALDLLYELFTRKRLEPQWNAELKRLRKWLSVSS